MLDLHECENYSGRCYEIANQYLGFCREKYNRDDVDLHTVLGLSGKKMMRADLDLPQGVETFLKYVAASFPKSGRKPFDLTLLPKKDFRFPLDMEDFISWLVILDRGNDDKRGRLCIVYDSDKIVESMTGLTEAQLVGAMRPNENGLIRLLQGIYRCFNGTPCSVDMALYFAKLVRLTKVKAVLHEGAHIVLHLDSLMGQLEERQHLEAEHEFPKSTARQENEAWVLAIMLWSMIVGDTAEYSRYEANQDNAWKIA